VARKAFALERGKGRRCLCLFVWGKHENSGPPDKEEGHAFLLLSKEKSFKEEKEVPQSVLELLVDREFRVIR